jgi:acyl-coenzyme A thioesterase PaaI-like protein
MEGGHRESGERVMLSEGRAERILLPWSRSCFVCGEANPQGLQARIYKVGDVVEMAFVPRQELVGWSDVVHGGLIGTVLDEVMTWAAIVGGRRGYFAADYAVRMKRPLAPGTECMVRARVVGSRRQILDTEGWVEDQSGVVFASATGRYLPVPPERLAAFRHDFIWRDDALDLRSVLEAPRVAP